MNDIYSGLTVFDGNTFAIVSYGHIQHSSGKGEFYRWERRQLLLHLDTQVLGLGDEKAEVVPPHLPPSLVVPSLREEGLCAHCCHLLNVKDKQDYRNLR